MAELVRFESSGGDPLLVEVDDDEFGVARISRRQDGVIEATQSLEDALKTTRPSIATIVDSIRDLAPDEYEIEFGMKLNAEAGVIVAKTALEGHFTVKLTWKRQP
jgi:hypothetical protein